MTEATVLGRLQRGRAKLKKELLTMVEDTLKGERLPDDFASQVRQLLEKASAESREREASVRQLTDMGGPAVDPLCQAMGDPRPVIRRLAARALCRIGDARALRPIMRALYAGDYWLYNTVFRAGLVMRIPGAREEMLKIAKEGRHEEQYWAIHALGHARDDPEIRNLLLALFRDATANAKIRCNALAGLCQLRPDMACDLVVEGLRDPQLRRLSGWAWWIALKNGLVVPLNVCLGGFARDVAPQVRAAAGILALRHREAGVKALEKCLHSEVPVEREAAAVTLARQKHPGAFEVLLRSLQHGGQERKWGRIMSRELLRHFADRLIAWAQAESPDLSNRPELAWGLAQAQLQTGHTAAIDLLHHGRPTVRAEALGRLVEQSGPAALPELRRCLAEGKPKKLAREAFWRMHDLGPAAEPAVLEMFDSPQWTERKAAVSLLRRWHRLTAEQKAQAEKDPHVAVRHAADWHPDWRKAAAWHERWGRKIGKQRP